MGQTHIRGDVAILLLILAPFDCGVDNKKQDNNIESCNVIPSVLEITRLSDSQPRYCLALTMPP